MAPPRTVNATDFKAKCLGLLDDVEETHAEIVITKRGKPVARLVPIAIPRKSLRGIWKDKMTITGDIVNVDWTDLFEVTKK